MKLEFAKLLLVGLDLNNYYDATEPFLTCVLIDLLWDWVSLLTWNGHSSSLFVLLKSKVLVVFVNYYMHEKEKVWKAANNKYTVSFNSFNHITWSEGVFNSICKITWDFVPTYFLRQFSAACTFYREQKAFHLSRMQCIDRMVSNNNEQILKNKMTYVLPRRSPKLVISGAPMVEKLDLAQ